MTTYHVRAPDGKLVSLEGPAGASQADVIAQAQKLYNPAAAPKAPAPGSTEAFVQRWQHMRPEQAATMIQRFSGKRDNAGYIAPDDPRILALQKIAGNTPAPPPPAPKLTRSQRITAAGRDLGNRTNGAPDAGISYAASVSRNLFGIPERLAAAGERFLPSSITGNTSNASYNDILQLIRAKTDAEMGRSTTGNVLGAITGGVAGGRAVAGAVSAGAGGLASLASPTLSRVGNVLQNVMTVQKGQRIGNAARVVAAGGAAGGAQALGEGSNVVEGAGKGAAGAAVLGTGFKAAQVVTRPLRDVLRLSGAGQILSRITNATTAQLQARAAAYRQATGAEPTLFELLPLADRNKILKSAVVGRDSVVEHASAAIRNRANNLGPEMSARAREILQPNRDRIHARLLDDLEEAHGRPLTADEHALAGRAMDSPTDMHELRQVEARAIMAPHNETPAVDDFRQLLPHVPQNNNGSITMVDADPEVTAAIRSVAPAGYRANTTAQGTGDDAEALQPVTAGDISDMVIKLRKDLGRGGIESRAAERAIAHLEGVLGDAAPEAAAAHAQMTDAYAARSRMLEGMTEGSRTRLRNEVQVGTDNKAARKVRNAYDTPEGAAGRELGQSNQVLGSLEGSPEEALRSTVGISRNSTGRQLAQNVGAGPADQIGAAARAQDESAQVLSSAARTAQGGNVDTGNAETLVQAIVGLHPSSFMTTKAGAIRKLVDMTYIPENRARTMVDMLFSQDPAMTQRAINAVGNAPNGGSFLQYLGGAVGGATAGTGQAGGTLPEDQPQPLPPEPVADEAEAAPDPAAETAEAPAAVDPNAPPVDAQSSSPYAANLQQLEQNENPELLALIDRQFGQESHHSQFGPDGKPLESSAGAIGYAQVMPKTAPEAARLAGLPWDEHSYRADPVYNKLLGIAYMSQQLRKYDGDVAKALAAYNWGPDRVDRALASAGEAWTSHLPDETRNYIQKVM
jgi:hypothetical protein